MLKKFAYLTYAKQSDQFLHNKLINKLPRRIKNWYILKYNPFLIADVSILETEGYKIIIPIFESESEDKIEYVIKKTLEDLTELDVAIASLPRKLKLEQRQKIIITDSMRIFPFFIVDASIKALKKGNRSIKNAEYLIIDGDNDISQILIYLIYKHINFLTVMTNRPEYFYETANKIYEDNGLNLQILTNSKNPTIKNADVIINTSTEDLKYDYFFKQDSIYFDIVKNKSTPQLQCKRNDMQVINELEFRDNEGYIKLDEMEMATYITSNAYKKYLSGRYTPKNLDEISNYFRNLKIPITTLISFK